ncbi:MAG: thioredoxin family protein [Nitrospinae bacterium]|nr:thioredoxin family protein [Nitrospinota bacterium]
MKILTFSLSLVFGSITTATFCETVKDREGAIRDDKAKMENSARWIYSDIDKGFAEAKKSGKPLMVVLRCVPCLACMGIDTQVLIENTELTPLMDQFVRVRVIDANALDLSLFQFDYDLSFTTMFFNADGTVYGRYGSWAHQKDSQNKATASFKHALEGVLKIHQNYPANKQSLAGKQGAPSRFKTPVDIPGLKGKFSLDLSWDKKVVQSCVHCHMIGGAITRNFRDSRKPITDKLIYAYPPPDAIGIQLSDKELGKVEAVAAGSPAAAAGLKPGDEIVSLAGQPLISTADFSWVLHNSPDSGILPAVVKRNGKTATLKFDLPTHWRAGSNISDRVGTWPLRAMAFGGMIFTDFIGIVELGKISAGGIMLCMISMILLLPALITVEETIRRLRYPAVAPEWKNRWLEKFFDHYYAIIFVALVLFAVALLSLRTVAFDHNLLHLQAHGTEAVKYEMKVIENAERSAWSTAVLADSLEDAIKKHRALENLSTVGKVESIVSILPEQQEEKIEYIKSLGPLLKNLQVKPGVAPVVWEDLVKTMKKVRFKLQGKEKKGEKGGVTEARKLAQQFLDASKAIDPETAEKRLHDFSKQLFADYRAKISDLKKNADATPVRVEEMPENLRARFISPNGIYLINVYPSVDVWDIDLRGKSQ